MDTVQLILLILATGMTAAWILFAKRYEAPYAKIVSSINPEP